MCEKCAQSPEEKAAAQEDANLERIRDYAWNWFSYHAEQRTSMFNYSLAAAAILAAGYGTVLDKSLNVAAAIGFLGATVMACFMVLDFRNRHLVEYGERALKYVEAALFKEGIDKEAATKLAGLEKPPAGILLADTLNSIPAAKQRGAGLWIWAKATWAGLLAGKHRVFLPLVEIIVLGAFLGGGVVALWCPELLQSQEPDPTASALRESANTIADALQGLSVATPGLATPPPALPPAIAVPAQPPQPPQ
jgi:hypothetical protein